MFPRITEYVHELMKQRVHEGSVVIDATMGNGHDTLYLAKLVGHEGRVFAFDIQEQAIESTHQLLKENKFVSRVELILQSHADMEFPENSIDFVVFNLGYLPGADKKVTTKGSSTIQAVEKSLKALKVGGLLILVVYWGHEEGKVEKESVEQFVEQIPYPEFMVLRYQYVNPGNHPPFVFAIERRKA